VHEIELLRVFEVYMELLAVENSSSSSSIEQCCVLVVCDSSNRQ
jgi:hypothetical protein